MTMLSKKKQRRYLAEKEQRWLNALIIFDESREEGALHRLRLEIKKIRALVELAKVQSGKRAAGHFRGLKKMFRKAGAIRDTGNQVRFLEARHLLSQEHKERQTRSMQLAADAFAARIRRFRKKGKKASKRLQTDMRSIHVSRIRRWYAREIIRIGILLTRSGEALHEARKRIKTLLYVQKLLPAAITKLIRLNTDYLDRLQEAIGQWHDAVVATMDFPDDNSAGMRLVSQEMLDKEQAVRMLAEEFSRQVRTG